MTKTTPFQVAPAGDPFDAFLVLHADDLQPLVEAAVKALHSDGERATLAVPLAAYKTASAPRNEQDAIRNKWLRSAAKVSQKRFDKSCWREVIKRAY